MNEFRQKLLGGEPASAPLLRTKDPKAAPVQAAEEESFAALTIPRTAARTVNHRDEDRHRLGTESAELLHNCQTQSVSLINLSGGGAMIEGATGLTMWDRITLRFGECDPVEAIVRWIRGDRIGVEFAHETRIEIDPQALDAMLRAVLRRSFPDIALQDAEVETGEETEAELVFEDEADERPAREVRHPLIWSGHVYFNHDSTAVRLRNISAGGALVEGPGAFPVGAELLLDLGEAGSIFCTVHWARGDQTGLKFHAPYDVSALAKARPQVAGARWVAPDYLRDDRSSSSPWASQWGRSDLAQLHRSLSPSRKPFGRR